MTVEAPTQIPNRPLIARNSPNEVARLKANHNRPVMIAPTVIIFLGLTRSASHPISGPAAPPQLILNMSARIARDLKAHSLA